MDITEKTAELAELFDSSKQNGTAAISANGVLLFLDQARIEKSVLGGSLATTSANVIGFIPRKSFRVANAAPQCELK